jgi:hypothetical protein
MRSGFSDRRFPLSSTLDPTTMSRWEHVAMRTCLTLLLLPAALAAGEGAVIGWRGNGQGFFPLGRTWDITWDR